MTPMELVTLPLAPGMPPQEDAGRVRRDGPGPDADGSHRVERVLPPVLDAPGATGDDAALGGLGQHDLPGRGGAPATDGGCSGPVTAQPYRRRPAGVFVR